MSSNKVLAALVLLVIALAGVVLWRQLSSPRVGFRPSAAVGEVLADEVGRLAGGPGKIVVVSREVAGKDPDAAGQSEVSFAAALRRQSGLKLVTELAPRTPGVMDLGAVSPEQFLAALERNPDAKVVVVFAGLPACSPALAQRFTGGGIRLVAVCGYTPTLRRWLESKALALAVIPRLGDPPAGAATPKTPKDWFDREYQIVTPATLTQMPY